MYRMCHFFLLVRLSVIYLNQKQGMLAKWLSALVKHAVISSLLLSLNPFSFSNYQCACALWQQFTGMLWIPSCQFRALPGSKNMDISNRQSTQRCIIWLYNIKVTNSYTRQLYRQVTYLDYSSSLRRTHNINQFHNRA